MDLPTAYAQINKRFIRNWTTESTAALGFAVPYTVDNIVVPESRPHARLAIISLGSEQITIGRRAKVERRGIVEVRLIDDVGRGRGRCDLLFRVVQKIFERKRFGESADVEHRLGIVTQAASAQERRGERDSPSLFILVVSVPFEFRDITVGVSGA